MGGFSLINMVFAKKSFKQSFLLLLVVCFMFSASFLIHNVNLSSAQEPTEYSLNVSAIHFGEVTGTSNADYETVRTGSGASTTTSGTFFSIHNAYSGGNYYIKRGFLIFNTSDLPADAIITSATVRLRMYANPNPDFNLTLQNTTEPYPHNPLSVDDYNLSNYAGDLGAAHTSVITSAGQWLNFTLTTEGQNYINSDGLTKFCLRATDDINDVAPVALNIASFYFANAPQLDLTYTLPYYSANVNIIRPYNTTLPTGNVLVDLDVVTNDTGTPTTFYNFKNGTDWIFASNKTYTGTLAETGFINGIYTIYAYVNTTQGNIFSNSTVFSVAYSPEPTPTPTPTYNPLEPSLSIVAPKNQSYVGDDVRLRLTYASDYSNVTFNVYNGTWLYTENVTYTEATDISNLTIGSYDLYVWGVYGEGNVSQKTVSFTMTESNPELPQVNVDWLWSFLYEGDFLGFIQAFFISNFMNFETALVLLVMMFLLPLYLRTKSLLLMSILWLLVGGFFVAALPSAAAISVLFMVLGVAGLLFRLFRNSTYT